MNNKSLYFKNTMTLIVISALVFLMGFDQSIQAEELQNPYKSLALKEKIPSKPVSTPVSKSIQQLENSDEAVQFNVQTDKENEDSSVLKAGVTVLKVTRGKSQMIRFAQPIIRVSISDPTLADVVPLAPDQFMINGKQRGVTSLIVWDEYGQEGVFDLFIENDTSELLKAVEDLSPNENIKFRVTDDSFVISGQVSNSVILDEIRRLASAYGYREGNFVDLTETPKPQVVLEVKIAEASRNTIRDLKTSFSLDQGNNLRVTRLANNVDATFDAMGALERLSNGLLPGTSGRDITNFTLPGIVQGSTNVGGLTGVAMLHRKSGFQTAWDLLETRGKISTLAEPSLLVIHNEEAEFLAGGEFPYVSGTDQNGSPLITFREFGVKLKFKPTISIRSKRIMLAVEPEVSTLDPSNGIVTAGITVPGLIRRSVKTSVELNDGQSLMISGILTREEQETFVNIPFIGQIPIIGNLFKNRNTNKQSTELMVIVTPHIVSDKDKGQLMSSARGLAN